MSRDTDAIVEPVQALVIGAGPAGLAAAESLSKAGVSVVVAEAKPSPARKFLMAGKSGLNLTKDEPVDRFVDAVDCPQLTPILRRYGPDQVHDWAGDLGEALFTGSSGRVFPNAMKGSPLLRRWLARLAEAEVILRTRWRWAGWDADAARFETPEGVRRVSATITVLALGGASWPRLGSDAAWIGWLRGEGIEVNPFRPANMGFDVAWSAPFRGRFAGYPVKSSQLWAGGRTVRGEFVITQNGIEGSAIYALSSILRDQLELGPASLGLDLLPDLSVEAATSRLSRNRGKASLANHLRKTIGLTGARAGLLRELGGELPKEPSALARLLKTLKMPVLRPRPLAEAISSAGGVSWSAIDPSLMLHARPGTFVAGEMLDWEAPTGGYLLTGCLATGWHAGDAAAKRSREG